MDSSVGKDGERSPRVRQQAVITELGQRALETDDLDELLSDATVAVAETVNAEYCHVLELLPDADELVLRQGVGWDAGLVGTASVPTERDSQAGYTLLSEEPIIADDLRDEGRFAGDNLLRDHDVVSGITVPIGSIDAPWGVLGTFTSDHRAFTEHDANFVQSVASILAAAVERANKDRRLREREAQLNVATQAASIGLWSWDVQANVVTADEFLAESYGMESELAAEGAPMATFFEPIHEDDTATTWEQLERALETGTFAAEYRVRDADGTVMWVVSRGEVEYDRTGEPVRLNGAIADITERKRREQALEESEERYRDLFTSMSEGYCVIEKLDAPGEPVDFRYVEANPAFEEHTGIDDVVGRTLREVVPKTTQKWVDTYDHVAETGEPVTFERELVAQGRILECYAFPVGDETTAQVGVIFTDITERVEHERRLEELVDELEESNERLEQFAYAASHDLQEPLRMVTSYLQLIEARYEDALDEDAEEFIAYAVDGAERMREMIDGLLAYSRIETQGDPFEPTDLNAVLDDVLADLQLQIDEHDAEITCDELPRVHGDGGQLRQVFQNLLDNAIEYSGDDPPRIHVAAERDGSAWRVSVRDEGIGIDPDQQSRVFDVFQRLHSRGEHAGMGIGLALCQRIVERHGGDIRVESEPGAGATFSFTLPAAGGHVS
ncbi:ATP-binding protein [Haloterrigena alkaliphila]|uniref:histidine kinase n=1 Tax=Haloterrigena alkaliphila TaxID=2816475 RepID=A0A8A2VL75_9EURY|nr:ATP-binding protein [Haloterrigena alkaliphila]QSX01073.1 ATP-binding protein [Haloterrigena alkaliphila]